MVFRFTIWRVSPIPDTGPNEVRAGMEVAYVRTAWKFAPEFTGEAAKMVIKSSRPVAGIGWEVHAD
jgi:hypothetical protein